MAELIGIGVALGTPARLRTRLDGPLKINNCCTSLPTPSARVWNDPVAWVLTGVVGPKPEMKNGGRLALASSLIAVIVKLWASIAWTSNNVPVAPGNLRLSLA